MGSPTRWNARFACTSRRVGRDRACQWGTRRVIIRGGHGALCRDGHHCHATPTTFGSPTEKNDWTALQANMVAETISGDSRIGSSSRCSSMASADVLATLTILTAAIDHTAASLEEPTGSSDPLLV